MKISQVEARRLKRRVEDLERIIRSQRDRYARLYPGGVNIAQHAYSAVTDFLPAVVANSRALGHAVVVVDQGSTLLYYAIPHPEMPV